jgi:long-chain fatty acid transport protein
MTHGSCETALGGAGVASPCDDGSAILFSPAAIAEQRSVVGAGWTGITTSGSFTYDYTGERITRGEETTSVPFGFASVRVGDRLAAGVGVFAPYGLHIDWPVCPVSGPRCSNPNFEGRFVSYDTELKNIYLQPTAAYRAAEWLSLGAGLDVVLASIDLNQRADLAEQVVVNPATGQPALHPVTGQPLTFANFGIARGTDFADAHLEGDGIGVGFHVGATAHLNRRLSLGVRYLHSVEIDYDGTAEFTPVSTGLVLPPANPLGLPAGTPVDALLQGEFSGEGRLTEQGIATTLTLPNQLVVGLAYRPTDQLELLADYQYTGWKSFDAASIDFEGSGPDTELVLDYQNTSTYRLGGELWATDALAFRAGFIYNTAAEKDFSVSPLLPEAERNYYSFGAGYRLASGLVLDAAWQLVDQSDRRGRVRGREPGLSPAELEALNVGVYHAEASVFNVTLSYHFGAPR